MVCVWWIRRDFSLEDNPALIAAVNSGKKVLPLYIFSKDSKWKLGKNASWWEKSALLDLKNKIPLVVRSGNPLEELQKIIKETGACAIYCNRCYEPEMIKQDTSIKNCLYQEGILVETFNQTLLFEPWILPKNYKVFTPYWKACLQFESPRKPLPIPKEISFYKGKIRSDLVEVEENNELSRYWSPTSSAAKKMLKAFRDLHLSSYVEMRDFPAMQGTSLLSPYLHFGQITPHTIWYFLESYSYATPFLRQLGWREFAYHLLFHFPKTPNEPLYEKYRDFPWNDDSKGLKAWKEGQTGYPIVDAGMRELIHTGWMHNRVRMIVGSFLVKDLLIPWQQGTLWFWEHLVDADLANNTLGWQWVAGCGADAAPYFRVFNPTLQGKKFDPEGDYIKKWVPELKKVPLKFLHEPSNATPFSADYPKPIVDHKLAKNRALSAWKTLS